MGLIALTSLPSITPKMNWREWRLLQSHSGWLAVITATVSVCVGGTLLTARQQRLGPGLWLAMWIICYHMPLFDTRIDKPSMQSLCGWLMQALCGAAMLWNPQLT